MGVRSWAFPLGWTVAVLACSGGPSVGERCESSAYHCDDPETVLECREGLWTAIPCRGAAGCREEGEEVLCDVSDNLDGDLCPGGFEGEAICDPARSGVLNCRAGVFTQAYSCLGCRMEDARVTCSP